MSDPLLDVLLQSVSEDKWELVSYDWQDYLDHLRRIPQSSIANEQQYLETVHNSIKNTLVSLTQTSYSQFIDSSHALTSFSTKFDEFKDNVLKFNDQIPELDTAIQETIDKTQNKDNSSEPVILLKSLDKVQDILQLPSLALACVRNGYYSEALDLASHTRRLRMRYNNIRIIDDIQNELDRVMELMMVQLLKLLRRQAKPATLIKVISYLRRMSPFTTIANPTPQLQQLYLASRLHFIRTQLWALQPLKQTPDKYLKRYIEVYRELVYPTIVSFRSIFPDKSSTKDSIEEEGAAADEWKQPTYSETCSSSSGERLIADFLRTTVSEFRSTVEELAPSITDQSTRNSLWLQIAYCTQSLGRIGGDFWPGIQGSESTQVSYNEWLNALEKQRDISKRLGQIVI